MSKYSVLALAGLCLGGACPSAHKTGKVSTTRQDRPASLAPAQPPPSRCPAVSAPVDAGRLRPKSLDEASGLVASRANGQVLWLHNDSGDGPKLYATRVDGTALGTVEVKGAEAKDWEDIAIGPGPEAGKSFLFVGDIGDNDKKRESVQIYRMPEPALDAEGHPTEPYVTADRIEVRYEDGPRDAETLLSDPRSGDLYIVQKARKKSGVYRIAAPKAGSSEVIAKRVAEVKLVLSTGGDVRSTGDGVAVRTYLGVSYWPRDPEKPLETAFASPPCGLELGSEAQGEAFGFTSDGNGYHTVSEGEGAMLHAYRLQ